MPRNNSRQRHSRVLQNHSMLVISCAAIAQLVKQWERCWSFSYHQRAAWLPTLRKWGPCKRESKQANSEDLPLQRWQFTTEVRKTRGKFRSALFDVRRTWLRLYLKFAIPSIALYAAFPVVWCGLVPFFSRKRSTWSTSRELTGMRTDSVHSSVP